jgi:DNA-binding transcriptional regulator YiaG
MTARQLRMQRRRLNLSQAKLARALKVSTNTVSKWEQGHNPIPPLAEVALEYVKLMHKQEEAA